MPKVVREHEIFRVTATIHGKDHVKAANDARREVLAWAQRRSGGRLPPEAWEFNDFEYLSGGRNSVGVRIISEPFDIWAIRADDPDRTVPGRIWTTEVMVGTTRDRPRFSVRLIVSTPEDELSIEPHTPGFVQQVAEKCGLSRGDYELNPTPWFIEGEDEAERLVDMLIDPTRELPVFVITEPIGGGSPLIDSYNLARATLGAAHVVVVPIAKTRVLTNRFGRVLSVFNGAVRTYLPGFNEESNPYAHRLVLGERISSPDGAAQCLRWMRSIAATESVKRTHLGKDVWAFTAIRNASLKSKQQQLAQEGASDAEQLDAAQARIASLEREIGDEKATQEFFAAEHEKAEDRAETAETQLRAAAFQIQQLLSHIQESAIAAPAQQELPKSWHAFAGWCDSQLAGRLILSPPARRNVRAPKFDDPELAARCLLWLATICRDRRITGGEGSLSEAAVEDGIRNAHCGGDQFDLDWQGQRFTADWHIKSGGNTHDPTRCLRIYYFWDPETQQIVIADMPAHRRTALT